MTTLIADQETGEILPSNVMIKSDKAPAIIIDISDVNLYHSEPEKLVEKIRVQASYAVFDITTEKGRKACNSHYNQIIKCIAPACDASKAKAADAKKVINQDLFFRKNFEAGVREIAEFHRKPLTEYEKELQRVKDEFEAAEAAKLAEAERIKQEAEAEDRRILEEEKAALEIERLKIEQEKQQLQDERSKIDLEIRLRAEAEELRIADEKRHSEQLARQAEEADKERVMIIEKAELARSLAIKEAEEKAERESEEKARIEQERIESDRIALMEAEQRAKNATDKEKLALLSMAISKIEMPEVGEEAGKCIKEVSIMLGKVCAFIDGRADKL
jgi:hypothetical protein